MRHFLSLLASLATAMPFAAFAQTTIDHSQIAYFVPDKRVRLEARVTDPKGVKVARAYFKAGAQADYTYVPMTASGPGRYVATLPAPSAATPNIEYLFLAQNNDGAVARTEAYTVAANKSAQTPAWQSASNTGEMKVYTELPNAPKTVAGFTDSIALDVAESGARLGATAGLYGGAQGGAAGSSAATTGTTTGATTATAAGGLSTMAIVGGLAAVAGVAAAAGGGGGGGGGGSAAPAPPTVASYAGNWSGTWTLGSSGLTGSGCTPADTFSCTGTWSGTSSTTGTFSGTASITGGSSSACSGGSPVNFTGQMPASGLLTTSGIVSPTANCPPLNIQFSLNPRRVTSSFTCSITASNCTGNLVISFSGS